MNDFFSVKGWVSEFVPGVTPQLGCLQNGKTFQTELAGKKTPPKRCGENFAGNHWRTSAATRGAWLRTARLFSAKRSRAVLRTDPEVKSIRAIFLFV